MKYKTSTPKTFFSEENRLHKLSEIGDRLIKINSRINWEIFRPELGKIASKSNDETGGRPAYDVILMFKILFLQRYFNCSDDQTEFQINDRLSFQRFLNLTLDDDVPDAKTVWAFRERIKTERLVKPLFKRFLREINRAGIVGKRARIMDASFVDVPKQRNSRDENSKIKNGQIPNDWKENKSKLSQKDTDARWTKKNDETHYGYKNHIKVDAKSKVILNYHTTAANVHDSQALPELLDKKQDNDCDAFADSAYTGPEQVKVIAKNRMKNKVHEKGARSKTLTKTQQDRNYKKSKVRVRVEHVFGFMTNTMKGIYINSIGKLRAEVNIGLMNFAYNIDRYCYLSGG